LRAVLPYGVERHARHPSRGPQPLVFKEQPAGGRVIFTGQNGFVGKQILKFRAINSFYN